MKKTIFLLFFQLLAFLLFSQNKKHLTIEKYSFDILLPDSYHFFIQTFKQWNTLSLLFRYEEINKDINDEKSFSAIEKYSLKSNLQKNKITFDFYYYADSQVRNISNFKAIDCLELDDGPIGYIVAHRILYLFTDNYMITLYFNSNLSRQVLENELSKKYFTKNEHGYFLNINDGFDHILASHIRRKILNNTELQKWYDETENILDGILIY